MKDKDYQMEGCASQLVNRDDLKEQPDRGLCKSSSGIHSNMKGKDYQMEGCASKVQADAAT